MDENPCCGFEQPGYRTYCNPTIFDGTPDRLFRNNGDGTFTDVSKAAGIANPAGKGLGVVFCDVDRDGDVDIYVANDPVRISCTATTATARSRTSPTAPASASASTASRAPAWASTARDFDGNGFPDILVTNFRGAEHALQESRRRHVPGRRRRRPGLARASPLGFGTKFFDDDNDGDLDLYVANGHIIDNVALYRTALSFAQKLQLYENVGGALPGRRRGVGPALQIEARRPRPRGRRHGQRRRPRRRDRAIKARRRCC